MQSIMTGFRGPITASRFTRMCLFEEKTHTHLNFGYACASRYDTLLFRLSGFGFGLYRCNERDSAPVQLRIADMPSQPTRSAGKGGQGALAPCPPTEAYYIETFWWAR
jgi:hypothetical protein